MAERLGRCNTKRRRYLRYCREHRQKLAAETNLEPPNEETPLTRKHIHDDDISPEEAETRLAPSENKLALTAASTLHLDGAVSLEEDYIDNQLQISVATTGIQTEGDSSLTVVPLAEPTFAHSETVRT